MKQYMHFKCTDCHRVTEVLVNNTHVMPDLCNITRGCEGRLQPTDGVGATGITVPIQRTANAPSIVYDSIDSIPHERVKLNSTFTTDNTKDISLVTGTEGQVVLALRPSEWFATNSDGETVVNTQAYTDMPDSLDVLFETATSEPAAFTSFIFRNTQPFVSISGRESGLSGKNLRYNITGSTPDTVEVRVNGVLRNEGDGPDDYRLFGGDTASDVAPNTVKFNSAINPTGIIQVDVSVSKYTPKTTLTLTFKKQVERIESRIGTGAYENINTVERFDARKIYCPYQLYVMDLAAKQLPLNSVFVPAGAQFITTVDFANAFFVLAVKPYSQVDRYNAIIADFKKFDINDGVTIQYTRERQLKVNTLNIPLEAIAPVYPPLKFNRLRIETPIATNLRGDTEQSTANNGIIIGPDT